MCIRILPDRKTQNAPFPNETHVLNFSFPTRCTRTRQAKLQNPKPREQCSQSLLWRNWQREGLKSENTAPPPRPSHHGRWNSSTTSSDSSTWITCCTGKFSGNGTMKNSSRKEKPHLPHHEVCVGRRWSLARPACFGLRWARPRGRRASRAACPWRARRHCPGEGHRPPRIRAHCTRLSACTLTIFLGHQD